MKGRPSTLLASFAKLAVQPVGKAASPESPRGHFHQSPLSLLFPEHLSGDLAVLLNCEELVGGGRGWGQDLITCMEPGRKFSA